MKVSDLSGAVEKLRQTAIVNLDTAKRSAKGQYFTPWPVAQFMASLFDAETPDGVLRLLDAGAGTGALTAAFVSRLGISRTSLKTIHATLFEPEPNLQKPLAQTLELCARFCAGHGVEFIAEICQRDFIAQGVAHIKSQNSFLADGTLAYDCAILNPPYLKMPANSAARRMLKSIGIETSNFYSAFAWLAFRLIKPGGQMVAITPRSFCNGAYFRPFRQFLKIEGRFRRLHVYESRREVFAEDDVLQENIVWRIDKNPPVAPAIARDAVVVSSNTLQTQAEYQDIFRPNDPEAFIHIPLARLKSHKKLSAPLKLLGLKASTGRVVDFRAREHLRDAPGLDTAPLLYPTHISSGAVIWPAQSKKPNAIVNSEQTRSLLIPSDVYVLVKRFSSKEERRRLSAVVYEPGQLQCEWLGIENHLNYIHADGKGIAVDLAHGLSAFLNSTIADDMFRQFNGHTQVNATDLRNFSYPEREALIRIGRSLARKPASQQAVDEAVTHELSGMRAGEERE